MRFNVFRVVSSSYFSITDFSTTMRCDNSTNLCTFSDNVTCFRVSGEGVVDVVVVCVRLRSFQSFQLVHRLI